MLKVLGIVAAVVVVLVAGILVYAATKPDSFRVQRTASIKAPPDKIFLLINDPVQTDSAALEARQSDVPDLDAVAEPAMRGCYNVEADEAE